MSKDKSIWTDEDSLKVLKEIKFDNIEAKGLEISSAAPVTVTVDVQQPEVDAWTVHNELVSGAITGGLGADDIITVTLDDLEDSEDDKQLELDLDVNDLSAI